MSTEKYVLHYWPIRARAFWPAIVASVGGVDLEWNAAVQWPEFKSETPFGQIPVLTGPNDLKIGQSLAIGRFLARKGNLLGETDAEYAASEQAIAEFDDLWTLIAKAMYGADRTKGMDELFATGLKPHLDALSKLLKGDTFTGKVLAGDLALFTAFDILISLEANVLDAHPVLKAFYAKVAAIDKVKAVTGRADIAVYFKRHSDPK